MSDELDEDWTTSADEMLNWLCWMWATDAQSVYPPDKTATEYVERNGIGSEDGKEAQEKVHHTIFTYCAGCFEALQGRGFDPVARAVRHTREQRADGTDLDDIDWTWWEAWNGEQ